MVHCTAHEVCFLFVGPGRTIRFPAKTVCVERQGERHVNEIRIRYRRRGLRLGQGDLRGLPGAASEAAGRPGAEPEVRPLYQCGPGDYESLSARRGVRHRGRSRDGPGPGPLRAVRGRGPHRQQLRVLRQDLLVRAEPGAPGRLPGRHGADHPPHHRRDQAPHLRHGGRGRGRGHHGDRRHRGRH